MDLMMDLPTGELVLSNGDLALITGSDAVLQDIHRRLRTFLGEWFLDIEAGVPYYQDILKKNPNPQVVATVIQNAILGTLGVIELQEFDSQLDSTARQLTVTFKALTTEGVINYSEILE